MNLLGKIGELLVKMVEGILYILGYRYVITFGSHKINVSFDKPKNMGSTKIYDKKHYVNGNIYLHDGANPIKLGKGLVDGKYKIIPSGKFAKFMEMKLLDDIARLSEGDMTIEGWKLVVMMVAINTIVCGFLLVLLLGVI